MIKLKKRPFCGQDASVVRHEYNGANDTFGVKCNWCKSQGNQFYETIDDAVSMWNERYHDVDWVLSEEDAKNYKIPEKVLTKEQMENLYLVDSDGKMSKIFIKRKEK